MAERLRRFIPRAFRYVLRPQDRKTMRFSLDGSHGGADISETILINLSETGVAFVVSSGAGLEINERIKVEIPIPEGEQIAWWGRIVRLQAFEPTGWQARSRAFDGDDTRVLVAIRFDELPDGHTRAIRKGLERSFMQAMRDQQYRNWLYYRTYASHYVWKVAIGFVLLAATAWFLWYFSQPSSNYDGEKGAPWGERYKF
jgi:hypothetical protein